MKNFFVINLLRLKISNKLDEIPFRIVEKICQTLHYYWSLVFAYLMIKLILMITYTFL